MIPSEEEAVFGPSTDAAVRAFQHQRGLWVDGVVGRQTWSALVEAGRHLGDRLLYHRQPMLRGDDVATLQRSLGALGFDAGKVDGIFGPDTRRGLEDFQLNVGLRVDGICGQATLKMLSRVSTRGDGADLVASVRERARLRDAPRTLKERRVAIGDPGGLGALAETVRRTLIHLDARAFTLQDPDESEQASEANAYGADLYIGLRLDPDSPGCRTAYFLGHNGYRSEAGYRLARILQATVSASLTIPAVEIRGMRIPILRETRMPAVLLELGPPPIVVERGLDVARAIGEALGQWVAAPY